MKTVLIILFVVFAIANVIVMYVSMRLLKVKHNTVVFKDLPQHLNGFKILHITDLHNRNPHTKTVDIWPHIKELDFDIAVITGDIVVNKAHQIDPHKQDLAWLASHRPTYYVEGNHDTPHLSYISKLMSEVDITFLYNQRLTVEINNGNTKGPLDIIGTIDWETLRRTNYKGIPELFNATQPQKNNNFSLVLTHQPQLFDNIKKLGINMVLCGHTHGGQVRLPYMPTLYAPWQGVLPKYGSGFYYHKNPTGDDTVLYVSHGIGATTFPIRYFNRPQIDVFELVSNTMQKKSV